MHNSQRTLRIKKAHPSTPIAPPVTASFRTSRTVAGSISLALGQPAATHEPTGLVTLFPLPTAAIPAS